MAVTMSVIMASVVGIKPKPQFMGFFQFMGTHSGSPTTSENKSSEPDEGSELALTGWWRRGRVELPVQKALWPDILQACPELYFLRFGASPG